MGVVVLGMHRSGTSAITAAVAALGVPLGVPNDRMAPREENAEGFHESVRITTFNELVLRRMGGRWDAPPRLPAGWHDTADMSDIRAEARAVFASVYPTK